MKTEQERINQGKKMKQESERGKRSCKKKMKKEKGRSRWAKVSPSHRWLLPDLGQQQQQLVEDMHLGTLTVVLGLLSVLGILKY